MEKIKEYRYKMVIVSPKIIGAKKIYFANEKKEFRPIVERLTGEYPELQVKYVNYKPKRMVYDDIVEAPKINPFDYKHRDVLDSFMNPLGYG